MHTYPLYDSISVFVFEDLQSWQYSGAIVSLSHCVDQSAMEGYAADVTMCVWLRNQLSILRTVLRNRMFHGRFNDGIS